MSTRFAFDIHARDGNMEKFSLRGGISPITGSLLVEKDRILDVIPEGAELPPAPATLAGPPKSFVKSDFAI